MRIGVLLDHTFDERPGGASRATQLWLDNFPAEHELVICKPGAVATKCDGYVLLLTKLFNQEELDFVLTQKFVRYEFDYWYDGEPMSKFREPLNEAAQLILFPSYLHRDVYGFMHKCKSVLQRKAWVMPPPMNPDLYTEHRDRWNEKGREGAIWFGEWHWLKGPDIAMNWALRNKIPIDMFSPSMPPERQAPHKWVNLLGFHPEERWFDVIAAHKYFVHIPREPQCLPYSMLEAYLLGCEVVVGGRTGVESYYQYAGHNIDSVINLASSSRNDLWLAALRYLE